MNIKLKLRFQKTEYQLEVSTELTVIDLKNTIIQQYLSEINPSVKYIDLNFIYERPITGFGKYSLFPGKLNRVLDARPLSIFNLKEDMEYIFEIDTYNESPEKTIGKVNSYNKGSSTSRYVAPNKRSYQPSAREPVKKEFSLQEEDFPPLS